MFLGYGILRYIGYFFESDVIILQLHPSIAACETEF